MERTSPTAVPPSTAPRQAASEEPLPTNTSLEEIERELNERLSQLGLPVLTMAPAARATAPLRADAAGATQILNLSELRHVLRQQVRIAEIKEQVAAVIQDWHREQFRTGEIKIAEFELRAAGLLLPYCQEFIPNFPATMRPVELAVDLNLETILRTALPRSRERALTPDEVDRCAVQVLQALLKHPLIPQTAADQAEVSLQTTVLRDKNGTAVYSPSDAAYLRRLIEEQKLLDREGEIGLLAMLVSARKWQKITDDTLFAAAVEYTLEALAKRRGIPSIVIRNQGADHPVAYILSEYIQHHLSDSLEGQITFVETFLNTTVQMLREEGVRFVEAVRHRYLSLLRQVFFDLFPEVVHRFLHAFEREFLGSSQTIRSKLFLLKRIGDFCELAFYCHEAMRNIATPTGDIYAIERLTEGAAHFARRNNLPVAEGMDAFNQRNTLAELLINAIKHRYSLPMPVGDTEATRRQVESLVTSDLLNCLNHLRRVFDHNYARARENSYEHYLYWRGLVLEWSRTYVRLLTGRTPNDVEQYHLDNIAAWHIEQELAFTKIHFPVVLQDDQAPRLTAAPTMRQPHEVLKEAFLRFWRAFHVSLLTRAQERAEHEERFFAPEKTDRTLVRMSVDDLGKRAFLARSDLPLATYTFERLAQHVTPQTHDALVISQSIEVVLELASQAYVYEEVAAARTCLRRIQRRLDDLLALSEAERLEYRARIPAMLHDLDRREPIRLASYIVALSELETLELTDERVFAEWQTLETTIQRLTEITCVLLMMRSRPALRALAQAFGTWYASLPETTDTAERRTYAQRWQAIQDLAKMTWVAWWLRRCALWLIWKVQCVASVPDWHPPETYILEDCLGLDTPEVRVRDLETVLASYPPTAVARLAQQLRAMLTERLTLDDSGNYYTNEERALLEKRLQRIERLARRQPWQAVTTRWMYLVLRWCLTPLRRWTAPHPDTSHPQQS